MPLEELPKIGLGTYSEGDREQWGERVRTALDLGYRHVDTAQDYGNEAYLGEGIEAADVPREELFLATKVSSGALAYDDVLDTVERSLENLRTEYLDLLYVHWPTDAYDPEETLSAFDELRDRGAIRHVGVSNFESDQLDRARDALDAPIVANQVECHPFLPQEELRAYAREHDHWLVAYCPLAQGAVFEDAESGDSVVAEIAETHDVSPAQVALAWLIGKENVAAIPKASSESHMRDNLSSQRLELTDEEAARIDAIEREHRVIDPDFGPWNR
ncbi:aldo/keto reductase [Saliphagus infecundisoli]|uniref:Aldo/keto reductase n=1 Tax=Saliphagus infecundisoli TaxID=1849069 RepID=A0ABD5QFH8_9EURY|nr:aldo/keto reductase [Saliphagus infecundisoli]